MTTETADPTTVLIDGKPVPLDDCIWLERRPCGCIATATTAVVPGAWCIATAGDAYQHWYPSQASRDRAAQLGLTAKPITGARYRAEFADNWHCSTHTR